MSVEESWKRLGQAWSRFSQAASYHFQIGPFSFSIHSATPALVRKLTRAFDHLEIQPPLRSDLTIFLWDTSQPGQILPALAWDVIQRSGYRGYERPPFYLHYFETIEALSVLHTEENKAYYIVRNTEDLPWWVSGSPLQVILHAWFQKQGMQLVHTAAVSNGQEALLLAGKGGSGKSTTTLACLIDGLYYIAEDYALLVPGKKPQAFSLYHSAKWKPYTRVLFPAYNRFIANPQTADGEKALIYYRDIFPQQIEKSSTIKGIVSLEVGSTAKLKASDEQSSLKSLMMSTVAQLPFRHEKTLPLLKGITSAAKHYHLTLGSDMKANVQLIRQLL